MVAGLPSLLRHPAPLRPPENKYRLQQPQCLNFPAMSAESSSLRSITVRINAARGAASSSRSLSCWQRTFGAGEDKGLARFWMGLIASDNAFPPRESAFPMILPVGPLSSPVQRGFSQSCLCLHPARRRQAPLLCLAFPTLSYSSLPFSALPYPFLPFPSLIPSHLIPHPSLSPPRPPCPWCLPACSLALGSD